MLHSSTKKIFTENTNKMKVGSYLGYMCYNPADLEISQNRETVKSLLSPNPILESDFIPAQGTGINLESSSLLQFVVST